MTRMRSIAKPNDTVLRYIVLTLIGLALAAITGRLSVHNVNDTPSYVDYPFSSLREAMLSIRTPGYPIFLLVAKSTVGLALVPLIQVLLHSAASWLLVEELLARGMPIRSALAAGFCVLVGCTAADHINTISTDAPAASLGVISAVLLMKACRRRSNSSALLCALFCALVGAVTIFVRPAYLFLIPWIAVAGWLLEYRRDIDSDADRSDGRRRMLGLKIAGSIGCVVLGWMMLRLAIVSDFAIAPFGHQNMSAMLVQTVPPETLRSLPGPPGELGHLVADELERQGYQLPETTGALLPTLTIESQWDVINYGVIWPLARDHYAEEDANSDIAKSVLIHRRIGALNRAILAESPGGYFRWLALGVRRSVWGTAANLAMHPIFFALILIGMIWLLIRTTRGPATGRIIVPPGWNALAIVTISYAIFSIGFVILSSPPLGRFADAGAIFVPGLIASLLVAPKL